MKSVTVVPSIRESSGHRYSAAQPRTRHETACATSTPAATNNGHRRDTNIRQSTCSRYLEQVHKHMQGNNRVEAARSNTRGHDCIRNRDRRRSRRRIAPQRTLSWHSEPASARSISFSSLVPPARQDANEIPVFKFLKIRREAELKVAILHQRWCFSATPILVDDLHRDRV
jgi:hypothetical protein